MLMYARSILFMIWLYGSILVLGIIFSPAFLLPRNTTVWGMKFWARSARFGLRWICGVKTEFRGLEHLPKGACLVASKHQSMYDILMPFIFLEDPAFVMKKELMYYPIFGWYAWKAQMIPIDRGGYVKTLKKMMRRAGEELKRGRQFLIFPEGTRRIPGDPPAYKSGVAAMYSQYDVPCVPIALNTGLCWAQRGMRRWPGHVVFEIQPPIEPGLPRDEFMKRLEAAIEPASDRLREEGLKAQGRSTPHIVATPEDAAEIETHA